MNKGFSGDRIRSIGFLVAQVLFDAVIINLSLLLAMQMRYEPSVPPYQIRISPTIGPFLTALGSPRKCDEKCTGRCGATPRGEALHIVMGTGLTMAATMASQGGGPLHEAQTCY